MKRIIAKPTERDDPRIIELGRDLRRKAAHDLADELISCGADLDRFPDYTRAYQDLPDDGKIRIPAQLADILVAILLSLPKPKRGPRPKGSIGKARQLVASGMSKTAAARQVASEFGEKPENIRRGLRRRPRK
jgi:hypothetical protein